MHKFFVQIYIFVLIIWAVEKSDCKQGAACLNYGHSCWGAHGKRNVPNDLDSLIRYRMAVFKKSGHRDSFINPNADQSQEDIPNYYNIFKHYSKINSVKTNNDDTVDTWSLEPSNNLPSGGSYYEDQVLDPRIEYKIMKI
ncbi:uncharacterized protein LOC100570556 isoform X2 [Acyrthosiphon pisum]|uniref:Uncharacterized protein n=1 Tax=Acyrthosiphon pisum TaxID=7029 RepID=A0A8R2A4Z7_ACYPI|nr:uncharacterized protein LOC100570556 isoform X2 [Acyrthosiphon pisum]|eukprot:XP_003243346.1 PREDICTED: uncharacterized protein LOC100570556 isoform X1 [Acyrthosiphon pisum]